MTFSFLEYLLLKQQTRVVKTQTSRLAWTLSLVPVGSAKETNKNLLGRRCKENSKERGVKRDEVIKIICRGREINIKDPVSPSCCLLNNHSFTMLVLLQSCVCNSRGFWFIYAAFMQ